MLHEFRAGECRADLVILRDTATAYEIKSERDGLDRLARQLDNYRKVFAKVVVIAGECHVQDVIETAPEDVGVLCLTSCYRISTLRAPIDRADRILPAALFESLRSAEARAVLEELGADVPDLPNTLLRAALRERFCALKPADLHRAAVKTLKRTRDLAPLGGLVERLPSSLHAAALSIRIRRADHARLVEAVEMPLRVAMTWT